MDLYLLQRELFDVAAATGFYSYNFFFGVTGTCDAAAGWPARGIIAEIMTDFRFDGGEMQRRKVSSRVRENGEKLGRKENCFLTFFEEFSFNF